jgi:hypothetical protein
MDLSYAVFVDGRLVPAEPNDGRLAGVNGPVSGHPR